MKKASFSLTGLIALAVIFIGGGIAGGYWFANQSASNKHASPQAANTGRKVLYWYDPMVPHQHFDKPGKSPFMDMELVPRYADNENNNAEVKTNTVRIDAQTAHNFAVRLVRVEQSEFSNSIDSVGSIEFNARNIAIVQAWADGYVTRVYSHAPGDVLKKNAALADVLVPSWLGAQNEFLVLLKNSDKELIAASRARLQALGMPNDVIANIERKNTPQTTFTITAPIDGVLKILSIRPGMAITRGTTLAEINDISTVWLDAAVPENQAAQIKIGDTLNAQLTAQLDTTIHGRVIALLPQTDAASRTLTVRAELDNRDGQLRPGQFARVQLQSAVMQTLTVPSEAIIRSGTRNVVIVAENNGYRPVDVITGGEANGRTAILKGLSAGQQIVASSQFLIDSEANLNSALNRLTNTEAQPTEDRPAKSEHTEHSHHTEHQP